MTSTEAPIDATANRAVAADDAGATSLDRGSLIMTIGGLGFVGYAVIFFIRNYTDAFLELGIGHGEVSAGRAEIKAFDPALFDYIEHLHLAISGFVAATGVAVAALAWFGVRRGLWWAWTTAVAVPVLALAVALPAHYPANFDTLGHLGLIYADTALFVVGAALAYRGLLETSREPSTHTANPIAAD